MLPNTIKVKLPANPTTDEKVTAIELILDNFIDRSGKFDIERFAKSIKGIQALINKHIPDWRDVILESPIYADDVLSEKFASILSASNPKSDDFIDLAHQINVKDDEGIKQFSSVEMNTGIPPLNEEIIIYHPGYMCCVQGIVDESSKKYIHVNNLSLGGDFSVPIDLIKWLPADRYNPVKTTEYTTVTVKGVKKFSNSQLADMIKGYLGD